MKRLLVLAGLAGMVLVAGCAPKVLVAYEREGVSQVAMTMPPAPNFDLAAKAGHSWALERIPAIYRFPQEDLVITLLDGPEFGKVEMS